MYCHAIPEFYPCSDILLRLMVVKAPDSLSTRWLDTRSLQVRLTAGVVLATCIGIGSLAGWMGWRMQQILLTNHKQKTEAIASGFVDDVFGDGYHSTTTNLLFLEENDDDDDMISRIQQHRRVNADLSIRFYLNQ